MRRQALRPEDRRIGSLLNGLGNHDLPDRTRELKHLKLLVRKPGDYEAIVGPPYSGKSTLLAFFARHPPLGVDVVSFFVYRPTGRIQSPGSLRSWADQLRWLIGERSTARGDPGDVVGFEQLWTDAVEHTAKSSPPRHLVLIVDGLDEQEDAISSLLPASIPDHVTVIVSSRENPQHFVFSSELHPISKKLAHPFPD